MAHIVSKLQHNAESHNRWDVARNFQRDKAVIKIGASNQMADVLIFRVEGVVAAGAVEVVITRTDAKTQR